jgi:murein L,D-transpeptidase YcbB/YkuD
MPLRVIFFVLGAATSVTSNAVADTAPSAAAASLPAAIQSHLETAGERLPVGQRSVEVEALNAFYQQREFQPMWVAHGSLNGRSATLLEALKQSDREGLDPDDYAPLEAPSPASSVDAWADVEIGLSARLLRYATDVRVGRVAAASVDPDQVVQAKTLEPAALLMSAADAPDFDRFLRSLPPSDPVYRGMRDALARMRELAAAGGWRPVGDGPKLSPGMDDPRVPALRRRLAASGDLSGEARPGTHYDDSLRRAVVSFQERHGLAADGVIGPQTLNALNTPVDQRIRQLILNMERWRWMPEQLGDPHIIVNMAGFDLRFVEHDKTVLDMRVVVGKPARRTPVFSAPVTHITFNPPWYVPRTIAVEDMLPKLRRNPGYFPSHSIRVISTGGEQSYEVNPSKIDWSAYSRNNFPFRFRQDPGPKNALGRIKFSLTNPFQVYLHDTPSRGLFSKPVRTFSSGCIRVEKPIELAARLLENNDGWSDARIRETIDANKTRTITLVEPVPIHLVYLTAWSAEDGSVQFREDIYGRDQRLAEILFRQRS